MKTATVQRVRHDSDTVLRWVNEGEQVEITKRGQIVALLSPPPPIGRTDLAARLKLRDGSRVIAARAMNEILDFNKGAR